MTLEILQMPAAGAGGAHPPLLFVHGSFSSAQIWAPFWLPWFSRQGYDCHAFSLRGHGASDGVLSWAGLREYGEDLAQMMASLATPPLLIGHSLGGLVVQHALAHLPCRGAVLLAAIPPSGAASSGMHMSMLAPDVLWQIGLLQSLGPEAVSASIMARAFLAPDAGAAAIRRLMLSLQRESPRVAAELLAPSLPTPLRGSQRPPVLVLGGDADVFLPTASLRETASFFAADLEILAGAPHAPMLDEGWWLPTAEVIRGWLAQHAL